MAFGGSRAPQAGTGMTGICHGAIWERNGLFTRDFLLRDRYRSSMSANVRWMSLPNVEHRGCEHVARCSGTWLVWYSSRNMYGAVAGAWEGSPSQGWTPRPPGAKQSVRSCKHGAAQHHARAAKLRLGRLAHALGKGCSTRRVTEGATWERGVALAWHRSFRTWVAKW